MQSDREILPLLVHPQVATMSRLNSVRVSYVDARPQALGSSAAVSTGTVTASWVRSRKQSSGDSNRHSQYGRWWLNP